MNIGILCYPTYGGSGVVATELGKELAMRGHQVHFISYSIPMRLKFSENIFFHKVEMASYPLFDFSLYDLALTSKIVEVAKYNGLDIVHAHYAIPHATSAYLAKEILASENHKNKRKPVPNLKIITTLHGTDITLIGLEISFLPTMKFSIEKSDGVTAVSSFLKVNTISQYNVNKDIEVIPNFIDLDHYKRLDNDKTKCLRKRYAKDNEKILVHTSNFRPLKRVDDCIKIFNEVRKKIPSKLLLIGDGPERSNCERLANDLGIHDDVTFFGNLEEFVEILSISDIFIMPSSSESFGLSGLEGMACGLPMVSSNAGGLPELNLHGETGYIAESGDVNKMAEYTIELLKNKNKYNVFSENARERAVSLFSVDKIVPQYEEYYKKILNNI